MMANLFVLAGIACARDQLERSSIYMGISDKAFESIGGMKPPFWMEEVYNPILYEISSQMDDSAFIKAWNAGHSMTIEQGLEFALDLANG